MSYGISPTSVIAYKSVDYFGELGRRLHLMFFMQALRARWCSDGTGIIQL